jgi:hypothetical protein
MDDKIIATFCLWDDRLQAIHPHENRQGQRNDAEVITTACLASLCCRGHQESARAMLQQYGYLPHRVRKRRCSRRLHRMQDIVLVFFDLVAQTGQTLHQNAI